MPGKLRIAVRKFEPFEKAIKQSWEDYCESSGCDLVIEMVPMDLHDLYESTIEQEGLRKGDWDIAHMNTDWAYEAYTQHGLTNLTSFLEKKPPVDYPSGWSKALLNLQQFGEDVVGLPFHDGPECLIYRKDLFEEPENKQRFLAQYGRALAVPQTWHEFVEVARFFHQPTENLFGVVMGIYPDGHNAVFDFCLQLWSRGGSLLGNNGLLNINTPEAAESLTFYKDLVQNKDLMHPKSFTYESVQAGAAFARGEAAMMINWFGFAAVCEVSDNNEVKGKVEVAPIPKGSEGKPTSLNVYWLYTIGAGSRHKEIAYDFIRFAVSPIQDKKLTMAGGIGCRLSTWHDEEINRLIPYYHKLEQLHQLSNTLPQLKDWAIVAGRIDQLIQQTINNHGPIPLLLKEAQKDLQELGLL